METNTVPETKISDIESNKKIKSITQWGIVRLQRKPAEEEEEVKKKKSETQHNLQNWNKVNWNGLRRKIMRLIPFQW